MNLEKIISGARIVFHVIFMIYIVLTVGFLWRDSIKYPEMYSYEMVSSMDQYGITQTEPSDPAHKCEVEANIISILWNKFIIPLRMFAFIWVGLLLCTWIIENPKLQKYILDGFDKLE